MSAGLLLNYVSKDLIIVLTENEPSVKILDLLGMRGWGGECGLASVPQAFKYFQQ